jgi:hypothetical protein
MIDFHRHGASGLRFAAMGLVIFLAGCGDGRPTPYPVTGRVTFAGQPLSASSGRPAQYALILLHPTNADSKAIETLRPHGEAGPDGRFALTSFEHEDGAPAGEYAVTITWPSADPRLAADDPEYRPSGPDRLRGRYADPQTTPFHVTIDSGTNEIGPFELKP